MSLPNADAAVLRARATLHLTTKEETPMLSLTDFLLRVAVALILGALIGFERQWRQRLAGLRTNTLFRPLVELINRQPLDDTEVETNYRCVIDIRQPDEGSFRNLFLHCVQEEPLSLRVLSSHDIDGSSIGLRVEAELVTFGRNDAAIDRIVGRLSREPTVNAIRWRIIEESASIE